jgi:hypothetical protein
MRITAIETQNEQKSRPDPTEHKHGTSGKNGWTEFCHSRRSARRCPPMVNAGAGASAAADGGAAEKLRLRPADDEADEDEADADAVSGTALAHSQLTHLVTHSVSASLLPFSLPLAPSDGGGTNCASMQCSTVVAHALASAACNTAAPIAHSAARRSSRAGTGRLGVWCRRKRSSAVWAAERLEAEAEAEAEAEDGAVHAVSIAWPSEGRAATDDDEDELTSNSAGANHAGNEAPLKCCHAVRAACSAFDDDVDDNDDAFESDAPASSTAAADAGATKGAMSAGDAGANIHACVARRHSAASDEAASESHGSAAACGPK